MDELSTDIKLAPVQLLAMEEFNNPETTQILFGGGAGGSKGLVNGTQVLTPYGWVSVESLRAGQLVIGRSGKPTRVLGVYPQPKQQVARVTFCDKTWVDTDLYHLWEVNMLGKRKKPRIVSTGQLLENRKTPETFTNYNQFGAKVTQQYPTNKYFKKSNGANRWSIPLLSSPVEYTTSYKLDIDPYTLGVWLGDGYSHNGDICGIDREIILNTGYIVDSEKTDSRYKNKNYRVWRLKGLKSQLLSIGLLNNKHIPQAYLFSEPQNRLALLQGLIDTDGCIHKNGRVVFSNNNKSIADGVADIVRSLGGMAYERQHYATTVFGDGTRKLSKNPTYTVEIVLPAGIVPSRLTRKLNNLKKQTPKFSHRLVRKIVDVRLLDEHRETTCIKVDAKDELFITKDYIVTHNTFLLCLLAVLRCRDYAGVREGLGRKELKQLKRTTVATLLHKVHPVLGIKESDFKLNLDEGITYKNGSQILFLDLAYQPSDPDMASLGSLELTDAFIDEAGEIHKKAADTLGSRVNRWMNKEHNIVGKTVLSCNPSQNFLRSDYYEPYNKLGAGRIQKWEHGEVWVDDVLIKAYRAYIRSTVLDNSFIDPNYIENLKKLPPQERKRLYLGDWNYADDDDSLFASLLLDKAIAYQLPEQDEEDKKFNRFIGVDVGDKGKDQTIATLIDNGVIVAQKELIVDKTGEKPISYLLADELIKFAQQNGFMPSNARNIAVEGNGVGVGIRDALRVRGWYIQVYEANGRSRSDGYYNLMLDMDAGAIKVLHGIDDGTLRQQLAAHTYEMENQQPKVVKKDVLKGKLGRSPDNADSAMIANWVRAGGLKQKQKVTADNLFF